jgi:hypothetical protein
MYEIKLSKINTADLVLIGKAVDRAVEIGKQNNFAVERISMHMDLCTAHIEGPLNLDKLVQAPDGDFGHDVFGINRYLDRNTGQLTECFVPRCAA